MPKQKPISEMLKAIIPYGKSCAGCRFLKDSKCAIEDTLIVDEVKVCRFNVDEE